MVWSRVAPTREHQGMYFWVRPLRDPGFVRIAEVDAYAGIVELSFTRGEGATQLDRFEYAGPLVSPK